MILIHVNRDGTDEEVLLFQDDEIDPEHQFVESVVNVRNPNIEVLSSKGDTTKVSTAISKRQRNPKTNINMHLRRQHQHSRLTRLLKD